GDKRVSVDVHSAIKSRGAHKVGDAIAQVQLLRDHRGVPAVTAERAREPRAVERRIACAAFEATVDRTMRNSGICVHGHPLTVLRVVALTLPIAPAGSITPLHGHVDGWCAA